MKALFTIAVVCLAFGVGLIFWFCNGSTSFDFAYPLAGTKLHLDITTTGAPALWGLILTVLGAFLLFVTWIIALLRPAGPREVVAVREEVRREKPFDP